MTENNNIAIKNNYVVTTLKIFLGCIFIFSGIVKLFPIEPFEFIIVKQGIAGWETVPYLSRLIIGFEIFLGFSLLQKSYIKKIFIPAAVILLAIFTLHLFYTIFVSGYTKDCGCFGNVLPMSSLEAIIKNIVLIILFFVLNKAANNRQKDSLIIPGIIFIIVYALIFSIFHIKPYRVPTNESSKINIIQEPVKTVVKDSSIKINLNQSKIIPVEKSKDTTLVKLKYKKSVSVFAPFKDFNTGKANLDEGIKIVALLSLDCDHCLNTAIQLGELRKKIKSPPVYILFFGAEEQVEPFFDKAKAKFPYKMLDPQTFFPLLEKNPPRICLLAEGNIVKNWNSDNFNIEELKKEILKVY
jgi:hypothetical protein